MDSHGAVELFPAVFNDKGRFDHFENAEHPKCFACNSEMMVVRPIQVTGRYVLLEATTRIDGEFFVVPGCWLVYPRQHVTTFANMPDDWTASVKQACWSLDIKENFNTGGNWGPEAGQTAEHGHDWITTRSAEEGLLSQNTGLATILLNIKRYGIRLP